MRSRTLILIILAVVLAGGTALLARSWLASERNREIASASPLPVPTPAKSVLVARSDLRRGQLLKPEDLVWQVWPEGGLSPNYIVIGTKTPKSFSGWVARDPIVAGEPITEKKVIAPGNRGFLAAVLRPGMRAVSVPVTPTTGGTGFIFPGDQVDLMITYGVTVVDPDKPNANQQNNEHKVAETVLRDIRVIAIDTKMESKPSEVVAAAHTATLEVTPKQSEIVMLANEMGKISLSLRSIVPGSTNVVATAPGPDYYTKVASGETRAADANPAAPDFGGTIDATYTLDSEISSLLRPLTPQGQEKKAKKNGDIITILRGGGKGSESINPDAGSKGSSGCRFLALAAVVASGLALSVVVNAAEPLSPSGAARTAVPTPPPVAAATPTPPPADESKPPVVTQVPASGRAINLEAGKGTLIRLSRNAGTVFVANPDVADVQIKSPSLIYISAKTPGETVLYAVDAEDKVLLNSPVRVDHDLSRVRQGLNTVAPGENVQVSSMDNSLVLSGNVSSATRAERVRSMAASIAGETKGSVVNRMAVTTPNQVNIRVKIAEVNRSVLKAIGVNFQKLAGNIQFQTNNATTGGQITAQNILALAFGGHNGQIVSALDALAQEGLLTTLAEPNLTATNGQPASFLAGGEFPIPVASNVNAGVQTITVEFKRFGVALDVTPTIIDGEHISLKIRPEVSELTQNGAVNLNNLTIPALTVRRAETTVELGSGESFILGGLLENTSTQNVSKIPALGDIPIIGQLFRSEQFQRAETELIIVVTPYLVKPTARVAALPTDGLVLPHDMQQIMHGSTQRQQLPSPALGPTQSNGGRAPIGLAGFRLD